MEQSRQVGSGGIGTVRQRIFGRGTMRMALAVALGVAGAGLSGCGQSDDESQSKDASKSAVITGVSESAQKIATDRGLTPDDVKAALATYLPSGKHDDYVMFASGGHSGQVFAVGVPSMRLLRSIAVFTPEPLAGLRLRHRGRCVGRRRRRWQDSHQR